MNTEVPSSPTALITGATGFVGSRLAGALAARGWKVHAIVRAGSPLKELAPHQDAVGIHPFDGQTQSLIELLKTIKPDIGFHLASLFLAQHKPGDIPALMESNITFGTQLLEAFAAAGVHRLINTGTAWQHFEDAAYCPMNLYAATKQAFEAILRYYQETASLQVIHLKLFDTYGPGDPRAKLISLLLKTARTGEPLPMSPGDQLIDLVHVDDVACAFALAAERLIRGEAAASETYGVSSGNPLSLRALVALLGMILGSPVPVQFGQRPYRLREVMLPWQRSNAVPGWSPAISLEVGLKQLVTVAGRGAAQGGG